jgi:hypothetical protein
MGRFWFCFLASVRLVRNVFWEGCVCGWIVCVCVCVCGGGVAGGQSRVFVMGWVGFGFAFGGASSSRRRHLWRRAFVPFITYTKPPQPRLQPQAHIRLNPRTMVGGSLSVVWGCPSTSKESDLCNVVCVCVCMGGRAKMMSSCCGGCEDDSIHRRARKSPPHTDHSIDRSMSGGGLRPHTLAVLAPAASNKSSCGVK